MIRLYFEKIIIFGSISCVLAVIFLLVIANEWVAKHPFIASFVAFSLFLCCIFLVINYYEKICNEIKKDAIKEARRQIIKDLINDLAIIRIKQDQEIKELENKLMELSRTQDLTQKEI